MTFKAGDKVALHGSLDIRERVIPHGTLGTVVRVFAPGETAMGRAYICPTYLVHIDNAAVLLMDNSLTLYGERAAQFKEETRDFLVGPDGGGE